jgi:hypothetical protein
MKIKTSTVMKFLACGVLAFLAAEDLQAQLLFKTKFCSAEGYTNGWAIGQPATGPLAANPLVNMDAADPDQPGSYNNGISYTNDDGSPWLVTTISNVNAAAGGKMWIHGDGGWGTNTTTYFWAIGFGTRSNGGGGITATWDWQYFGTNLYGDTSLGSNVALVYPSPNIPADYDPTNQPHAEWPDWDQGVCISDASNRWDTGSGGAPNWRYYCNSAVTRIASIQDCRSQGPGLCYGGGTWPTSRPYGPEFKDGKLLHAKCTAYAGLPVDDPSTPTNNCFDAWSWRDGEGVYQTAWATGGPDADGVKTWPPFGDRSCPGQFDPTSGLNQLNIWYNTSQSTRRGPYSVISNIRIVGPNAVARPTLSISTVGGLKVTYTGWLEAADDPAGPYITVAVQPYPYTAVQTYTPPAGTKKFYRASM